MDSNPFLNLNFVDLLQSQQDSGIGLESSLIPLFGTQATEDSNFEPDSPLQRKERRSWSQTDDEVLISSWLNTRKDAVVGTEQKSGAFWKRIVDYFAASPKLAGLEKREPLHCKNRWHKINDLVCKFCGAYEAAARQKTSGQNENDILKQAHLIFLNNNKKNSLWNMRGRSFAMTRSGEDDAQSSTSHATEDVAGETVERPPGVKAAKRSGKKPMEEEKGREEFERIWYFKQEDLCRRERLSKIGLLDRLLAKTGPLHEYEETLKKKLITELFSMSLLFHVRVCCLFQIHEQWEWNNQRRRSSIMLVSRAKKLYYACVTGEEALVYLCHGVK
ncbi:PREDICTED: glutathione S-transferase T3-like [Brassica oleracea var. oleracea]|uniref:glutathione S-transferase T3-like n=1 Tax=Brassica oleracea var. oleracea TaxID=109376 RepID=UPI0006A6CBC9|nr:PREDICTED: glutathione S-transferase T3-like [Brassica oleracea var. oleracea]